MVSHRFAARMVVSMVWCCLMGFWLTAAGSGSEKATAADQEAAVEKNATQGALRVVGEDATVIECPLQHTDVQADISGFVARVKVTQTFVNPTGEKIEAVYVFPLPNQAAVDEMTMVVGPRRIVGVIKRRDAARQIYEQALAHGQTAALLEQERPNIFTQSVGNIEPGQTVRIEISYVDVLDYDQGSYEFHFPMVVGPRFNPQASPGQPAVADAAKINPPLLKPDERTSHDISLTVNLEAGVPIQNLSNANHKIFTLLKGKSGARIRLLQEDSIPNKDFVLRYDVVGDKPEMAMLAHTGDYGDAPRVGKGYFMLLIQPKEDERFKQSPPREIVFLVDVSGSMSGEPTAKTRAAMEQMLKLCRDQDTLQVVTFASQAFKLFEKPLPVNEENIKRAVSFSSSFRGSSGTRMLEGVKLAIDQPIDTKRLRIVVMLTDGYIGNEAEIIEHVGKNCGDQIRFWALGVGSSPNMFLIDGVAKQGGGMGKRLGLNDDTKAICTEVITRIQRAQLAKIKIDWGELQVSETFPARLPELWAGRPVVVHGRYRNGGDAKISVSGVVEGADVSWPLTVSLPADESGHDVLAQVWARKKIEAVMHQSYYAGSPAVEETVTALALRYRLMSQYTSFVAVDEKDADSVKDPARPPRRMTVPVPLPEGTRYEGFFGEGGGGLGGGGGVAFGAAGIVAQSGRMRSVSGFAGRSKGLADWSAGTSSYFQSSFGGPSLAPSPVGRNRGAGRMGQLARGSNSRYAIHESRLGALPGQGRAALQYGFEASNSVAFGLAGTRRSGPARGLDLTADDGAKEADEELAFGNTWHALIEAVDETQKRAETAWKKANEFHEQGEWERARRAAVEAYLLDTSASSSQGGYGPVASQALELLEQIHTVQVANWAKNNPQLDRKLDLVLRDRPLADALAEIAKAADIKIDLLTGSAKDAASLQQASNVGVHYLDLRRATVSQALDWMLRPLRLNWWPSEKGIQVGSERRRDGTTCWIYDVSSIALPTAEELGDAKDRAKQLAAAKQSAEQFIGAISSDLEFKDGSYAVWFSPGQLLVVAGRETQAETDQLLSSLSGGAWKPTGQAANIVETTRKRASAREDYVAKQAAAARLADAAARHSYYAWQLLAAASGGQLDFEALTELQIVWHNEATAELLAGGSSHIALKSLWMICEASRALPNVAELQKLANDATDASENAALDAVKALDEKPDDAASFVGVLFAALALLDDAEYRAKASDVLKNATTDTIGLSPARTVVLALLAERVEMDRTELSKLVTSGVWGDELTMLLAMACRRASGELWQTFRVASEDLLGRQPLRGEVVVIVNHLPRGQIHVAER